MLIVGMAVFSFVRAQSSEDASLEQVKKMVEVYCGACHFTPSPDLLPKKSWPYVIERMAEIAEVKMGKPFIPKAHLRDITAYYYGSSPEFLPRLPYIAGADNSPNLHVSAIGREAKLPLITKIKAVNLTGEQGVEFLICDAESDTVSHMVLNGGRWKETVLAEEKVPSNAVVADMDGDGDKDVLISALGIFFPPTGVYAGKVSILEKVAENRYEKNVILEKVGRVTDAQPLDMDDDGDIDVALSIFGGDVPGEIAWLENLGREKGYLKRTLFNIGGGLNITPVDINNDGRLDLVTFITQEYEQIVALINRGEGNYEQALLFQASHPMVGPTSIDFDDIDMDGDVDIVFTNGDAHDFQPDPKPYHGVQWLENKGKAQFEYRELGRFYGAAEAKVGDWDGDGDNDIVASSWNNYWQDERRQTLIWYENDGKQNFRARPIIHEPNSIVSFEILDADNDGNMEILAGLFEVDLLKKYVNLTVKDQKAAIKLLKDEQKKPRIIKILKAPSIK